MGQQVLVAWLMLLCAPTSMQQGLKFDPNAALRASGSYETLKNIYRCAAAEAGAAAYCSSQQLHMSSDTPKELLYSQQQQHRSLCGCRFASCHVPSVLHTIAITAIELQPSDGLQHRLLLTAAHYCPLLPALLTAAPTTATPRRSSRPLPPAGPPRHAAAARAACVAPTARQWSRRGQC